MTDELARTYHGLRRHLMREIGPHDGGDVLHDAFDIALHYGKQYPVRSIGGLVGKIARQLVIDRGRRRASLHITAYNDELACEVTPERQVAARQSLMQLCSALDNLPPRCREAFVLCKLKGLTYHQAAAEMAIQPDVVRQYLVQAMRVCRRTIEI